MNHDEMKEKLIAYIKEKLQVDDITDTTELEELGEFSSIFVVELILFIEENFDLEVSDEDYGMENYKDVATIVALVIRNKDNNQEAVL
ncbi:acyl carrier protein [Vallitalea pronyensis]|uniref:Acyl carrier protein n=1 Tax=Vallitalea pronyensis TaxID=1348613 RepID=A0A8J8SFS7_9FIRM|nr:acyl carrier protein [Vallitalea pronyensis]QUI21911.1 acyl carrier protein [Vallitalea pronyensis]